MLATGPLVAVSGCVGGTDPGGETLPNENAPGDVGAPPRQRLSGNPIGTIGNYRGDTTVEFLFQGERRSTTSAVVVQLTEPLKHEGYLERNPFHLSITTLPTIMEAGEPLEGMYDIISAGLYFDPAEAPGLDYQPREMWMEQHWDLTLTNGQITGTLSNPNDRVLSNSIWYESPPGRIGVELGSLTPVPYDAYVVPSILHTGTRLDGVLEGGQFTATITGATPHLDAFRITVTAVRPQL